MRDSYDISKKSPLITCHLGNLILLTFFAQVILLITIAVCSYPSHAKELPESPRQVAAQPYSVPEEVSNSNGELEASRENNGRMDTYNTVGVYGQGLTAELKLYKDEHAKEPRHASSRISQQQLQPPSNKSSSTDERRSPVSYRGNILESVPQPQRQHYLQPHPNILKDVSSDPRVPQQQQHLQPHGNTPRQQQQLQPTQEKTLNNPPRLQTAVPIVASLQPAPPQSPPPQQTYFQESRSNPPPNDEYYSMSSLPNEEARPVARFPPQRPLERPYFQRPAADSGIPRDNDNNANSGRVMNVNGIPMEFRYAQAPLTPPPTIEQALWEPVFMYYQPLHTEETTPGYGRPQEAQGDLPSITDLRYQQSDVTLQRAKQYELEPSPATPLRIKYLAEERRPEQYGSSNNRYPGESQTDYGREVPERNPVYRKGTPSEVSVPSGPYSRPPTHWREPERAVHPEVPLERNPELQPFPRPSYHDRTESLPPSQPPKPPTYSQPYNPENPPRTKTQPLPKESLRRPLEYPESQESPPRRVVTTYEDDYSQRYSVPPQQSQQPQRHLDKNPLRRAYEEYMTPIRRRTFFQYAPRLTMRQQRMSAFHPNPNFY